MDLQRLDKIVASQFHITRSAARKGISCGKLSVNGAIIKDFSQKANPQSDKICYCGQALDYKEHIYIVMNKPKGVLSASRDSRKKTVIDLLPQELKRNGISPVGRLDRDTTGLLIITDDGAFAHNVISPKKEIKKRYLVTLDGAVTEKTVSLFNEGITLADGTKCLPAELYITGENTAEAVIKEGKYHQIKRMFGVAGLGVNELRRISVGKLTLPHNLECGQSRELTSEEIALIFD